MGARVGVGVGVVAVVDTANEDKNNYGHTGSTQLHVRKKEGEK